MAKVSSAPMLLSAPGLHRARVPPPGQRGQVRAGRGAEFPLQGVGRGARDVPHGAEPEPGQHLTGPLPHPPQRGNRQRVQEAEDLRGRHHEQPVGLAHRGRELGHELGGGHADRAGQPMLTVDAGPDPPGDGGGRPQPPDGPADVQERLIERERLDLGGHPAEQGHDLLGDGAVDPVARRHEHGLRAQPPRPADRHGRPHPERARLVAGRQHHAAAADGAHDHRFPGQLRPVPHLDAGVERVHVHVQDAAAGVVRGLPRLAHRYPRTWNWAAKSWNAGCAATASSRPCSAWAAPGSASATTLGTRSAKTRTPRAGPGRSPACSIRLVTPARVNRRGPPPGPPAAWLPPPRHRRCR